MTEKSVPDDTCAPSFNVRLKGGIKFNFVVVVFCVGTDVMDDPRDCGVSAMII